jgi:hypothetical protein
MIVFVLHGPYTDRAYAYTNTNTENYSGTVTTWHWLWGTCQVGTVCPGAELEYDRCLGLREQLSLSTRAERHHVRRDLQKGDLLAHDDILVNHFPMKVKIKTVLAYLVQPEGNTTTTEYCTDRNSVHVYHLDKRQDTRLVIIHSIHQSSSPTVRDVLLYSSGFR